MRRAEDPAVRFERYLVRRTKADCWSWLGGHDADGYGKFWDGRRQVMAHRFAYELAAGPIPEGLELDHLCRIHGCVNPAHLEPVTTRVNVLRGVGIAAMNARKTACKNGHTFTAENTYLTKRGLRACRTCILLNAAAAYRKNRKPGTLPSARKSPKLSKLLGTEVEPATKAGVDWETLIMEEIANPKIRRLDVAQTYSYLIRSASRPDWSKINAGIIERWSKAGLTWIKTKAWGYVNSGKAA